MSKRIILPKRHQKKGEWAKHLRTYGKREVNKLIRKTYKEKLKQSIKDKFLF